MPALIPQPHGWKSAIDQWRTASVGLEVPLKDWPNSWKTHRSLSQTYHNRKVLWEAYEECGCDDKAFETRWPEKTITKKLAKILEYRKENGSAKSRKSRAAAS